eukprot:TRINITY_DN14448_c0_g1_i4.p1 TRINITY_DN14448_c0_g1~~TRINITY_DN14448_c0_g1_i4.p1  ORF type:complete len:2721 (+),score=1122.55 TRINITY_DN14448_c0_g1_i4:133-8163(+)
MKTGHEKPCPEGTFGSRDYLATVDECEPCTPGYYCASTGLATPTAKCEPGHYCASGSAVSAPIHSAGQTLVGDICPAGHYCPIGSTTPSPCPAGTLVSTTKSESADACEPCTAGFYCPSVGTSVATLPCTDGFYCPGGQSVPVDKCPAGHFCNDGSSDPEPCPAGSYANVAQLPSCINCPAGFYCPEKCVSPVSCPMGFYCPAQTQRYDQFACPIGTFNARVELSAEAECTPCTAGSYCATEGLTAPTDVCAPGYYCTLGAVQSDPTDGKTGDKCDAGFVCTAGSSVPAPRAENGESDMGYICPVGYYCPKGSVAEIGCSPGTYNSLTQQSECKICPTGSICSGSTVNPQPCPLTKYCPAGSSSGKLCPAGSYGAETGLEQASQCVPCPSGKFCVDGAITADCTAGYICYFGNATPGPNFDDTRMGSPCPPGHFCPEGCTDPVACSSGTVRVDYYGTSQEDCSPCPAGFVCEEGQTIPTACPAGKYCLANGVYHDCPVGTYNSETGAVSNLSCLACPAGSYCYETGTSDPLQYLCPAGKYCLQLCTDPVVCPPGTYRDSLGASGIDDCHACPGGKYCNNPTGTVNPTVCEERKYCPVGSSEGLDCPGGSYCPVGSADPVTCPLSHFCPANSKEPIFCPLGTYCPEGSVTPLNCPLGTRAYPDTTAATRGSLETACESCPKGMYGVDEDRLVCETCPAGYVCLGGTSSATPTDVVADKGYACPTGYYCPEGSYQEISCPVGTYNSHIRMSKLEQCLDCGVNTYNNLIGQETCKPCSASSFADVRSTKCTCKGFHRSFQMTDGFCICEPGFEFVDENLKLQSNADGSDDCQPIVYDLCASSEIRSADGKCVDAESCTESCESGAGSRNSQTGLCECEGVEDIRVICDVACRAAAATMAMDPVSQKITITDPTTGEQQQISLSDRVDFSGQLSCSNQMLDGGDTAKSCDVKSIQMTTDGFNGVYGLTDSIKNVAAEDNARRVLRDYLINGTVTEDIVTDLIAHQRNNTFNATASFFSDKPHMFARILADSTEPAIAQPMLCLEQGDGIVFDLGADKTNFPVYDKDSLMNTNGLFDYGEFRRLAEIAVSSADIRLFGYSFDESGTYVFSSSVNPDKQTIIVVMAEGTSCPTEASILPMATSNLVAVGAYRSDDIILEPDWVLIGTVLLSLFAVTTLTISLLHYFKRQAWVHGDAKVPGYRKKQRKAGLQKMRAKGGVTHAKVLVCNEKDLEVGVGVGARPGADGLDVDRWDLDDLDVRQLLERLEHHHVSVATTIDEQKEGTNILMDTLHDEVEQLRGMLTEILLDKQTNGLGGAEVVNKHAQIANRLSGEFSRLAMQGDHEDSLHLSVLESLSAALDYFNGAPAKSATNVVEELSLEKKVVFFDEGTNMGEGSDGSAKVLSESSQELRKLLERSRLSIEQLLTSFEAEFNTQKANFQNLWNTSISTGLITKGSELGQLILEYKDHNEQKDMWKRQLMDLLRVFAAGVAPFVASLDAQENGFCTSLIDIKQKQNPALVDAEKRKFHKVLLTLFTEVHNALTKLLTASSRNHEDCGQARGALEDKRTIIDTLLSQLKTRLSEDLESEILREKQMMEQSDAKPDDIKALMEQIQQMVANPDGLAVVSSKSSTETNDEQAKKDSEEEESRKEEKRKEEAQKLQEELAKEEAAELDKLNEDLSKIDSAAKEEEKEAEKKAKQEDLQRQLEEKQLQLSSDEQSRLMEDLDKDQEKLEEALAEAKRLQQEALKEAIQRKNTLMEKLQRHRQEAEDTEHAIAAEQQAELQAQQNQHKQEIEKFQKEMKADIDTAAVDPLKEEIRREQLEKNKEAKLAEIQSRHDAQLANLRKFPQCNELAVNDLLDRQQAELATLTAAQERIIEEDMNTFRQALRVQKQSLDDDEKSHKDKISAARDDVERRCDRALQNLKDLTLKRQERELDAAIAHGATDAQIEEIKKKQDAELAVLEKQSNDIVGEMGTAIESDILKQFGQQQLVRGAIESRQQQTLLGVSGFLAQAADDSIAELHNSQKAEIARAAGLGQPLDRILERHAQEEKDLLRINANNAKSVRSGIQSVLDKLAENLVDLDASEESLDKKKEQALKVLEQQRHSHNDALVNALKNRHADELIEAKKGGMDTESMEERQRQEVADLESSLNESIENDQQILEEIFLAHKDDIENLKNAEELERQRQQEALKDRLNKKREEAKRALRLAQEKELVRCAESGMNPENMDDLRSKQDSEMQSLEEELNDFEKNEENSLKRLWNDHEQELQDIRHSLDSEKRKQAAALQDRLRARQEAKLAALRKEHDAQCIDAQKNGDDIEELQNIQVSEVIAELAVNDEERGAEVDALRRCYAQHELERAALAGVLEAEKSKQEQEFKGRLEARRLAKERALRAKQALALQHAAIEARKESPESEEVVIDNAIAKKLETEALIEKQRLEKQLKAEEQELRASAKASELIVNSEMDRNSELQKVKEQHESELAEMHQALDLEKEKQKTELENRLAARRAKREAEMKEQLAAATEESEKEKLLEEQEAARLLAEQEAEKERAELLKKQIEKEAEAEKNAANRLDDELAQVRSQHDAEKEKQDHAIKLEQHRQQAALEEKLRQRRDRKTKQLLREQQVQRQRLAERHSQEQSSEDIISDVLKVATAAEDLPSEEERRLQVISPAFYILFYILFG